MSKYLKQLVLLLALLLVQACATSSDNTLIAVIGDFGFAGVDEDAVAKLVISWQPQYVMTVGDNNYSNGEAETIDANIGQYYHDYIFPYQGSFGVGNNSNRFFPVLGNHDWRAPQAQPYLDYFTLPGNERYYQVTLGPIDFFALDSDPNEPDGRTVNSIQARWLRETLAASNAPWKIVFMHHPPYSSGAVHGSDVDLQWPYKDWGATAVLAGHDHTYERIVLDDFPYFVNGLGGNPTIYDFAAPVLGSQVRYNEKHGAMRITATTEKITFTFFDINAVEVDKFKLVK